MAANDASVDCSQSTYTYRSSGYPGRCRDAYVGTRSERICLLVRRSRLRARQKRHHSRAIRVYLI